MTSQIYDLLIFLILAAQRMKFSEFERTMLMEELPNTKFGISIH
jgi:hypothetical protein